MMPKYLIMKKYFNTKKTKKDLPLVKKNETTN